MRWPFPRSLRTQILLSTLGVVLLVQAATVATLSYYRQKLTQDVAVSVTATTFMTLRAALARMPVEERADFVREASRNEWRLWSRRLPDDARLTRSRDARTARALPQDRPPVSPFDNDLRRNLRDFIEALNARLGDGTRVALSRRAAPMLFVSLAPDEAESQDSQAASQDAQQAQDRIREWLVIPLDSVSPPVATPLIVGWLGGMGLLLLLAATFSWHVTRPLTRLANAADQLAAGQPQRVQPSGPTETRRLGERFNAMLDALAESRAVHRTLLAGLPHDLKGPLSRMWLRSEMSDDGELRDGMRKDIQDMQRMIDQFIHFVRDSDPGAYRFVPLDLPMWLEEQVAVWESTGCDVRLVNDAPASVMLDADPLALARLLDNLITNAQHHGAAPVIVSLAVQGDTAVLTVSDHGPGISADRREEALQPFSRLDDARTRTGSVGLGLALTDAIARAHGGSVQLRDAPSGGLAVEVRLPLGKLPRVPLS